jgi:ubiquinol-cytochrome c reductase cytochrome b subunit
VDFTFFGLFTIIPAKLMGVVAMFASILLLFFLPWLDSSPVRSGNYRPLFRKFFWYGLIPCVLVLGYCGGSHASPKFVLISQIASAYYFAHFLIILPIISRIEKTEALPNSITEAVLGKYAPALQPAE